MKNVSSSGRVGIFLGCVSATLLPAIVSTFFIAVTFWEFLFGGLVIWSIYAGWVIICFGFMVELFNLEKLDELGSAFPYFRQRFGIGCAIAMSSGGLGAAVFGLVALIPDRTIAGISLFLALIFLVSMGPALPIGTRVIHRKLIGETGYTGSPSSAQSSEKHKDHTNE